MIEVCQVPCPVKGCDLAAGRVVRDGDRLEFESFARRHHGRDHARIDLRSLFAKLRREGIDERVSRDS
jgi:hypothetical protein